MSSLERDRRENAAGGQLAKAAAPVLLGRTLLAARQKSDRGHRGLQSATAAAAVAAASGSLAAARGRGRKRHYGCGGAAAAAAAACWRLAGSLSV